MSRGSLLEYSSEGRDLGMIGFVASPRAPKMVKFKEPRHLELLGYTD